LVAAFLYAQLEEAEKIILARWKVYMRYQAGLQSLQNRGRIQIPHLQEKLTGNGHLFYILTTGPDERSRLISYLKKRNIAALFHYIPLHSSPAGKKLGRVSGDMMITNDVSQRLLRLPLYYEMQISDIDRVVDAINQFYSR